MNLNFKSSTLNLLTLSIMTLLSACSSPKPLPMEDSVNIKSFMGPWFVQGYTPILVDKEAHNAVEHYYQDDAGKILTTYQFRDGSFDGKIKTYQPTGFVQDDPSNAYWKMQFLWPIKADYIIIYLDEDKGHTIIGHPNRKYAWIMTRETSIPEDTYTFLLNKLKPLDYDLSVVQRLPQNWATDQDRLKKIQAVGSSKPLEER